MNQSLHQTDPKLLWIWCFVVFRGNDEGSMLSVSMLQRKWWFRESFTGNEFWIELWNNFARNFDVELQYQKEEDKIYGIEI